MGGIDGPVESDASGPYEPTSVAEMSSGDLILAGPVDDVWILQMASALTATGGRQVVLVGGARTPNVFVRPGTSAALVTSPMAQGAEGADQSVTLIAGPSQDDAVSTRADAVASGPSTVMENGGGLDGH